jgi:hypothetical protein
MAWSALDIWANLVESFRLCWAQRAISVGGKYVHRRSFADCAVRSHIVVVLTPRFDLLLSIVKIQEPVLVEAFESNACIEAFNERVIGRLARAAKIQNDAVCIGP